MKTLKAVYLLTVAAIFLQSCAIIRPGEVALKVRYGKIKPGVLMPGAHGRGIFGTRIERFNTRTIEYSNKLNFHSVEGIEVTSEITLLYHLIPDSVTSIFKKFDGYYETSLIINNLITALRQEGLNHKAVELITQRIEIEQTIREKLTAAIGKHGFVVDLVLIKEIDLPSEVTQSIQAKLTAEQVAKKTEIDNAIKRKELEFAIEKQTKEAELEITKQRLTLDFAIEKQRKESERLLIESEGIKKSQDILNSSITDKLIKFKALDITKELMKSPNAKIIITDGKSPVIVNNDK
jgi:prohibitin 1